MHRHRDVTIAILLALFASTAAACSYCQCGADEAGQGPPADSAAIEAGMDASQTE